MSSSHTKESKILLTFTSIIIGYVLKKLLKKGWNRTYQEDPPGEQIDEEVNWGKLILWTFLSGLILRVIKVAIKRTLAVQLEKRDLLID